MKSVLGAVIIAAAILIAGLFGNRYSISNIGQINYQQGMNLYEARAVWMADKLTGEIQICLADMRGVSDLKFAGGTAQCLK